MKDKFYTWDAKGLDVSQIRLRVWYQFGIALNFREGLAMRNRGIEHTGYSIIAPQVGIISSEGVEELTGDADTFRQAKTRFIPRPKWNAQRQKEVRELRRMHEVNINE